jgi:hypothetical protein
MKNNCCTTETNNSIEKFEENRSVIKITNKSKRLLLRHKVDGCLVTDGIKCDWMLVDKETKTEIYIELKGSDISHAVSQICATVDKLSDTPSKKWGYVICTRCPMSTTQVQTASKKVAKSHSLILRVKKTIHEESIESLIN